LGSFHLPLRKINAVDELSGSRTLLKKSPQSLRGFQGMRKRCLEAELGTNVTDKHCRVAVKVVGIENRVERRHDRDFVRERVEI
jgi:hypothetical protein